jgi:drug/metabolite transporter (DMT)-like permease
MVAILIVDIFTTTNSLCNNFPNMRSINHLVAVIMPHLVTFICLNLHIASVIMNPKFSLVIGILCISFSPILVKLADASPIVSAFYRMLLAWLVLAPYCLIKIKLKLPGNDLLLALLGGVIFAADIAVWNVSLTMISATVSTLIANLAPVWVGLMSYMFFKRKSGQLFWAGTILAMAGMVVLVGFTNILHLEINLGLVLALGASVLYAFYIMITKGILQRVNTLTFMFWSMLASSIFLLAICGWQHDNLLHYPTITWYYFIAMGLVCQLIGWITINYAIMHLAATKVAITLLTQTVIACFLAIVLLNEKLEVKEIIGSVIVLGGIAVTFLKRKKLNNFNKIVSP